MKKTCDDIKSTLKKYVDVSGYMLINLMREILFYVRWAELIDKILSGFDGVAGEVNVCSGIRQGHGSAETVHGPSACNKDIFALHGEKIKSIHAAPHFAV